MRERIEDWMDRIRNANRYAVASGLFLIWMLTLADVDLVRMVRTHQERVRIESRLAEHQHNIESLELDLQRMLEDPDAKVRHAREAYYMHKPGEVGHVIKAWVECKCRLVHLERWRVHIVAGKVGPTFVVQQ